MKISSEILPTFTKTSEEHNAGLEWNKTTFGLTFFGIGIELSTFDTTKTTLFSLYL